MLEKTKLMKLKDKVQLLETDHPDILDENNEFPSGTDLILNGTGDLEMSVDVGGNSTQKQYEGYNLLPNNLTNQTLNNINLTVNSDKSVTLNGTANANTSFQIGTATLQAGTYKFSGMTGFTISQAYINFSGIVNVNNEEVERTLSEEKTTTATISIINGTTFNNVTLYPMIKLSSVTDTDYEPYVGGQTSPNPNYKQDINNVEGDVEVKGKNRNIFDEDIFLNASGWTKNNGVYSGANNNLEVYASNGFPNLTFKENTQYTYKFKAYQSENGNSRFIFKYADGTSSTVLITATGDFSEYNLTSDINKTVEKLSFSYGSGNKTLYIKEFQLVKGTTTKDYVPHAENTVTFPLSQGQKLMLGDTLEDDGIHHKRGKITLNGTENWSFNSSSKYGMIIITNAKPFATSTNELPNVLCNCLTKIKQSDSWGTPTQFISSISNTNQLTIKNSEQATTLEELKSWLAEQYANGTPVTLEYELATETTETYTSAQQTAYNKLKEMQSYYDLTYVTGSSDNAQPILTAHAKKSIKELSGGDLSNYQTKITSTNKLNSDLVNDTNQTNKFVTTSEKNTWNAKQNTTDNNLATTNKNITSAINEVNSIAKGANQALSYASYSAMITAFSSASSTDYNVGQNIYIETLEVPDLWVYKVESTSSSYTYTTDSAFTTALETNGYVQVGYYKLSALETQKVDLTNYVEFTDYASSSTAGVVKISILTQSQYDALQEKDTNTYYYIVEE